MLIFLKNTVTFFVNKGNASFKDMKRLIDFVSNNVFQKNWYKARKGNQNFGVI